MLDKVRRVGDYSNAFGTNEYITLCKRIGCEPYICTNARGTTLEGMSDRTEYCNRMYGGFARGRIRNGREKHYGVKRWPVGMRICTRSERHHPILRRAARKNWSEAFEYIKANWGYDRYPGNCHIISNAAAMGFAMLYGEGDFDHTLNTCNMCGWDIDCNVTSIMGDFVVSTST